MEHQFTRPARVVAVRIREPEEDDRPTAELIGPAPVATDEGQPLRQDEPKAAA